MSVFRPSAQALIWIRVEELAETGALARLLPPEAPGAAATSPFATSVRAGSTPSEELASISDQIAEVESSRDLLSEADYEAAARPLRESRAALLLREASPADSERPWQLLGVSPDARFARFGIQPLEVEIERNGFRTADTAKITIDWKNVPFDPRIVRAAAIEVVVGVVTAEDFAAGMSGLIDRRTGQLRSTVPQNPGSPLSPGGATRFVGFVDDWDVDFGKDGDLVTLSCRDFTAIFADTPLASDTKIDLDKPLDIAIREFLANYPSVSTFPVRYVPTPGSEGRAAPAPVIGTAMPVTQRTRRGRQATRGRSGDQRMNLWDYLTDLCVPTGILPYVKDYELRLIDPTTTLSDVGQLRHMVYGRNLTTLSFARKLGGVKVPTIEVRAYDPTIARMRWARWPTRPGERSTGVLGVNQPPRPIAANEVGPTGTRPEERIQTFVLEPSSSPQRMLLAAQSIFNQAGRQEIEGRLETHDVTSWSLEDDRARNPILADLLNIATGDAISVLIAPRDRSDPDSVTITAGDWIGFERRERARYLRGLGFGEQVADAFAALQDAVAGSTFRVQNAQISYSAKDGISMRMDFTNFLEVRETASGPAAGTAASITLPAATASAAADAAGIPGVGAAVVEASQSRVDAVAGAAADAGQPQAPQRLRGAAAQETIDQKIEWEALLNDVIREGGG